MGLRSDPQYIALLADDAQAARNGQQSGYGVPLTIAEIAELDRRARTADTVAEVVNNYAQSVPDQWAGLYIDQAGGGRVVAQFTGDPDLHRVALARLLHPSAPLVVKRVRWSYHDLDPLWKAVERQREWFDSIGAPLKGSGISELDNVVKVQIDTADAALADMVIFHFDAAGKMRVIRSGVPPWTGGSGELTVHVTRGDVPPDRVIECVLHAEAPGALDDDLRAGMVENDTCSFRAPATKVTVTIFDLETGRELGRVEVNVPRDGSTSVEVAVR